MENSKYGDKLNAFFKQFEIPEKHDIHLLPKAATWEILPVPQIDKKAATNSRLLFYHSSIDCKDYLIIFTLSQGIDRFDVESNCIDHLTDFPDDLRCKGSELAINPENGDLYMIGGMAKCFAIYKIETDEWDIKSAASKVGSDTYSLSSVDNDPKIINNRLYITGWDANRWYDAEQDKFIEISLENTSSSSHPTSNRETKMIYNAKLHKYMHFGSDSSFLFSKELCNEIWLFGKHGDDRCLWHISEIGLPSVYKSMSCKYAISFESIVILVYFSKTSDLTGDIIQNEIHCLDLDNGQWYKGKAYLGDTDDVEYDQYSLFISNDAKIHMFYFDDDNTKHLAIGIKDILNDELYAKYNTKYKDLIHGYIKSLWTESGDVDCDIQSSILRYYTTFI